MASPLEFKNVFTPGPAQGIVRDALGSQNAPSPILQTAKPFEGDPSKIPTDLNLNNFYKTAITRGFSKDYSARVTNINFGDGFVLNPDDLVYIKSFSLPSFKVQVAEHQFQGYSYLDPGNPVYNKGNYITITFYADQYLALRMFFENLIDAQKARQFGDIGQAFQTSINNTITISIVDENLTAKRKFILGQVFVADINNMAYDIAGNGKVQEMTVTFGYSMYNVITVDPNYVLPKIDSAIKYSNEPGIPSRHVPSSSENGSNAKKKGLLATVLGGLNAVTQTAKAVQGAATAVRGAGRAIRGR